MEIIGYSESLSNVYSSEMRSRWMSHFLSGKFILSSTKEMEVDIENHSRHWKRITPFYWKSCHAAFHIWDNDNICRDMGWDFLIFLFMFLGVRPSMYKKYRVIVAHMSQDIQLVKKSFYFLLVIFCVLFINFLVKKCCGIAW